jgi:hypothetical protein
MGIVTREFARKVVIHFSSTTRPSMEVFEDDRSRAGYARKKLAVDGRQERFQRILGDRDGASRTQAMDIGVR